MGCCCPLCVGEEESLTRPVGEESFSGDTLSKRKQGKNLACPATNFAEGAASVVLVLVLGRSRTVYQKLCAKLH